MKRLWASLCCLAFVFAALAHATAFAADATGESAAIATLTSPSAGGGEPVTAGVDQVGCAEETDSSAGACAIDAVISPVPPLVPASHRRLANRREAAAPPKMNTLSPESPPPIACPEFGSRIAALSSYLRR